MPTKLSDYHVNDIKDQFCSRTIAFTPAVQKLGIGLGLAEANLPGYTPVPLSWFKVDTWDEASAEADRLNAEHLKLDVETSMRIVASSMAAGPLEKQGETT